MANPTATVQAASKYLRSDPYQAHADTLKRQSLRVVFHHDSHRPIRG